MIAHAIFFYFFSTIAVISAIMVTVSKNTVHSVFFLILDFISISCLFIMIGAEFLGMIMLIVYVGAVAVLFLFVVMMLNVAEQTNEWFLSKKDSSHLPIGICELLEEDLNHSFDCLVTFNIITTNRNKTATAPT